MPGKDLFRKPFDEGTLVKLQLFEDYFKEWLPVFLANPTWKEIQIFDLFSGEGKDIDGTFGSPLRILSVLNDNKILIQKSKVKIRVVINEFDNLKYELLIPNLLSLANDSLYQLEYYNQDFSKIFFKYYESMKKSANFLFLDQNGIKQITGTIFSKLTELKQTDFLFFISSSYIQRFAELEEFNKYLKITRQDLFGKSYYHIHRIVLSYYRNLIQKEKQYFLAPFSIKKPSGIYGLIFGSSHTYGLEKFLRVCWNHDKLTGEANFDIDNEKIDFSKPSLFPEMDIPKKKQLFDKILSEKIFASELRTNIDVYLFTLNEGFQFKDANAVLKDLKESNKIDFNFKLINSKLHKEFVSQIKLI